MNKVTCDVIQDLMPLYVDQMLSEDSCALIREHLEICETCKNHLEELKKESADLNYTGNKMSVDMKSKEVLKQIRRSILKKRLMAVGATAIAIMLLARIGYYFYAEHMTYIPYEETGFVMDGDKLIATKTYYGRVSSLISPDQKKIFYQMQETPEIKKRVPSEACNEIVEDFGNQIDPEKATQMDEDKLYGIEKAYYLPEEYVNYRFNFEDPEIGAAQTKELEEKSILLWEKSESY